MHTDMVDSMETKTGKRVIVIGLDGGSFCILDPLIKNGRMPNLKKLIDEGVRGDLQTVIPPITPAAWTTFMTGKNPGKHGVLEFLVKDGAGESPVNSRLRRGKSLWRIVSDSGKRVVSLSIPITYPPEKINGLMISDFMTPKGVKDYGYPPELLAEIERRLGPYRLHISEVYSRNRIEQFFEDIEEEVRFKFKAARFIAGAEGELPLQFDLFALHIHGADRIQHELWHIIDPAHPMHDKKEALAYEDRFYRFYESLDAELGRFLDMLRPDDTVFVISDHGFGPAYYFMNFNVWLMEKGYLSLRLNLWTKIKKAVFDLGLTPKNIYRMLMFLGMAKLRETIGMTARVGFFNLAGHFMLSFRDVDWPRTAAYSKGYYGQIFINLKGREPHGTVAPEDYEKTRDKIVAELKEIVDPRTGKRITWQIYRPEQLYRGPYLKYAPDVTFLPEDMTYKAIGMTDFPSNRFIEPVYANSGDHRMNGIFIGKGPSLKRGDELSNAWIGDMTPTILYALGLPVPNDMDGKTLTAIFTAEFLNANPLTFSEASPDETPLDPDSGYSDEEKESIKRKLKDMGYI